MRKRVRAARGYGRPREWVLTASLADAARGLGTRRREIESRERDNIEHADSDWFRTPLSHTGLRIIARLGEDRETPVSAAVGRWKIG